MGNVSESLGANTRAGTLVLLVAACGVGWIGSSSAQAQVGSPCGNPFVNHFGPWDYRTAKKEDREIVERAHFTPGVESMTKPSNTMRTDMAQDVSYTLKVFPNHHRALLTMQRLSEKHKSDPAPGANLTVECFFDRALRFAPDDIVARALFARYLAGVNRKNEGLRQLEIATEFAKDNPLSHYNIGFVYFEMGAFDKALARAHKAQQLGYMQPVLMDKLKSVNQWREPAGTGQ